MTTNTNALKLSEARNAVLTAQLLAMGEVIDAITATNPANPFWSHEGRGIADACIRLRPILHEAATLNKLLDSVAALEATADALINPTAATQTTAAN